MNSANVQSDHNSQALVDFLQGRQGDDGPHSAVLTPDAHSLTSSLPGIGGTHVSLHMDGPTLNGMLQSSHRAKVVLPKSAAAHAHSLGVAFERMTTTDSDLRVEYFKGGLYGRVYSVPSAHPVLDWTPLGGYPYLGYLIRFGTCTIYHAGDCQTYDGIVGRLRPYNVTAALLPIAGEGNFGIAEAAKLAEDIRARWLVPMHYGTFADQAANIDRFVDHMLGFHPSVGFKVFEPGEGWVIP